MCEFCHSIITTVQHAAIQTSHWHVTGPNPVTVGQKSSCSGHWDVHSCIVIP